MPHFPRLTLGESTGVANGRTSLLQARLTKISPESLPGRTTLLEKNGSLGHLAWHEWLPQTLLKVNLMPRQIPSQGYRTTQNRSRIREHETTRIYFSFGTSAPNKLSRSVTRLCWSEGLKSQTSCETCPWRLKHEPRLPHSELGATYIHFVSLRQDCPCGFGSRSFSSIYHGHYPQLPSRARWGGEREQQANWNRQRIR